MSDEPGTMHETAWRDRIQWLILLRVFRIAVSFRIMWLGALGVVLTSAGWWAAVWLFWGNPSHLEEMPEATRQLVLTGGYAQWPWDATPAAAYEVLEEPAPSFVAKVLGGVLGRDATPSEAEWLLRNPVVESWQTISRPFRSLPAARLDFVAFSFLLVCGIWAVAVWSLFGGAISRVAALQLCQEEKIGMRQALAHAFSHWGHYLWAPLAPLVFMVFLSLPAIAGGWLLQMDVGIVIAAVIWPLFLLLAFIVAIVGIGLLFGWPLMWATISTESTDSFDAMSRCYAYVYQRPLNYLFYAAVATLLGIVGWVVVAVFTAVVAYLPGWAMSCTAGVNRTEVVMQLPSELTQLGWPSDAREDEGAQKEDATGEVTSAVGRAGVAILGFWLVLVKLLAHGFVYGYFWTAATAGYLLLRRDVDSKEIDDVQIDGDEVFGLPELGTDEAGVAMAPTEETAGPEDGDSEEGG